MDIEMSSEKSSEMSMQDTEEQDIEITFDNGKREIHAFDTISFIALTSMFSCLLGDDKPEPEELDPEGELHWLLGKIYTTGITKIKFGTFRTMSFVINKQEDGTLGVEVRFHISPENTDFSEIEEKILKEKPKVSDLLQGLLSGKIKMEVLTPDDFPDDLTDMIREVVKGMAGGDGCNNPDCKICKPDKQTTH